MFIAIRCGMRGEVEVLEARGVGSDYARVCWPKGATSRGNDQSRYVKGDGTGATTW